MRSSQARSASPTRGVIRRRTARAPPRYFGCSARVAWLATWFAITLSQEGHHLATTASPGAARRTENGRSRADPAARRLLVLAEFASSRLLWLPPWRWCRVAATVGLCALYPWRVRAVTRRQITGGHAIMTEAREVGASPSTSLKAEP